MCSHARWCRGTVSAVVNRIDRGRTPKMNWGKHAADRRGVLEPEQDFTSYEVPEQQRGLGSWRDMGLRWPQPCQNCDTQVLMGLYNPRTGHAMCDRACLDTWRTECWR